MRVVALLLCGLVLAGAPAQEKKKDDDKKSDKKAEKKPPRKTGPTPLEGVWTVVSVDVEGKPWPAEKIKGMLVMFRDDQLTIQRGKKTLGQGTVTVDAAQQPAHLDYRESADVYSVYDTGIYQLENGTLRWCTTADRKKRPAKFDSKEGMLLELRKEKGAEPKAK